MDDTSFIFRISAGERDNKMCSNISRGSSDNDIGFIGQTVWVVGEGCRRRNLALRFFFQIRTRADHVRDHLALSCCSFRATSKFNDLTPWEILPKCQSVELSRRGLAGCALRGASTRKPILRTEGRVFLRTPFRFPHDSTYRASRDIVKSGNMDHVMACGRSVPVPRFRRGGSALSPGSLRM